MEHHGPLEPMDTSTVRAWSETRSELDIGRFDDEHRTSQRRRIQKTAQRIANDIVQEIVSRHLHTGDRLPLESVMAEQYGVSRSSLREALRLLEVQGLIHLKPGPGGGPVAGTVEPVYLAKTAALFFYLGAATYDDLLRTQTLLEPLCAQLAAANPDRRTALAPFLTPPRPDALTEARETRPGASPNRVAEYRHDTSSFHGVVYDLADNFVLALLAQAVTHIVNDYVVATMDPVELRDAILLEHTELARTIAAGHAAKAGRMMAAHFSAQHDLYRQRWPDRLDRLIEWR